MSKVIKIGDKEIHELLLDISRIKGPRVLLDGKKLKVKKSFIGDFRSEFNVGKQEIHKVTVYYKGTPTKEGYTNFDLNQFAVTIDGNLVHGLEKVIEEFNEDDTYKEKEVCWEIQISDDQTVRYSKINEIKDDILKGNIYPNMQARKIYLSQSKKESDTPKWQPVSQELANSSFNLRVLFKPIWAHTIRGAGIAAKTGIILWLAQGIYLFYQAGNPIISLWFTVFLLMWSWGFLPKIIKEALPKLFSYIPIGIVYPIYWIISKYGFKEFLRSSGMAFSAQIGAVLAGAVLFVFPGMILGTIIGSIRQKKIKKSPFAVPEGSSVFIRGIVIPAISMVITILLYFEFSKWLISKLSQ